MCLNPLLIPNPTYPKLCYPTLSSSVEDRIKIGLNRLKYELNFTILDLIRFEKCGYRSSDAWRYAPFLHVPCRRCVECYRSTASQWRFRLSEESRNYSSSSNHLFVTLTFSDRFYDPNSPTMLSSAIKSMHDKMYNKFGRRIKHWYCSEKGSARGRIHLHGILYDFPDIYLPIDTPFEIRKAFTDGRWVKYKHYADFTNVKYRPFVGYVQLDRFELKGYFESIFWLYGFTFFGHVNEKTFNYVTKYITKFEDISADYKPQIFSSPAIGKSENRIIVDKLKTLSLSSGDFLISNGSNVSILPKYYRDRIRKYITNATYYRALDRTMLAFGKRYKFDGVEYSYFVDYDRAKRVRYLEDVKHFPDMYKTYKNNNLNTIFLTEYGVVTSI